MQHGQLAHDDVVVGRSELAVHEAVKQRVDGAAQEDRRLAEHVERLAQSVAHVDRAGNGAREVADHEHQEDGDHHLGEAHLPLLVRVIRHAPQGLGRRVSAAAAVQAAVAVIVVAFAVVVVIVEIVAALFQA